MAITFDLGLKSVKGYFVGMMPNIAKMIQQPSWGGPSSTTGFDLIGSYYSNGDSTEYGEYLERYFTPTQYTIFNLAELKQWLYDNGSLGTQYCDVCEFKLVDNSTGESVTSKTLCLSMIYSQPSDMVTSVKMRLKTYNPDDTVSYTDLTSERGWRADETFTSPELHVFCGAYSTDGVAKFVFGKESQSFWGSNVIETEGFGATSIALDNLIGAILEEEEESSEAGESSQEDGYGNGGKSGSFDFHSDIVGIPPKPDGISEMGFVNIYKVSAGALSQLGATLFPDPDQATDVIGVLKTLVDAQWNSRLIDYVVSIHIIPGNVPAGSGEAIKIGTRTLSNIIGSKVTSDYVDVSLGSISTASIFANFCDFMTKCKLFLPFYGMVEIPPEYWMDGTLSVDYRINVVDGSFIAFVRTNSGQNPDMNGSTVIGQYSGCACVQCPTSGVAYGAMFSGMVSAAAGVATSVASGSIAGLSTSLMTVANTAGGVDKGSNAYNASASFMGCRRPFLVIEAPVPQFSRNYATERGIPSIVTRKLGSCSGFTIAENPVLDGIPCTEDEKERIRAGLKSGLIF